MTDVSKQILEKAHGGLKLNPDEQRRFLGTFEERVLGYAELATANDDKFQKAFLTILETFKKETEPLFVKISPQVVFEKQVYYLKQAKDADCQATIVSEDHNSSPFGMVIHLSLIHIFTSKLTFSKLNLKSSLVHIKVFEFLLNLSF